MKEALKYTLYMKCSIVGFLDEPLTDVVIHTICYTGCRGELASQRRVVMCDILTTDLLYK